MKAGYITLAAMALAGASTYYYHTHDPLAILRHRAEQAFADTAQAVASKDLNQVSQALQRYLAEDAQIHLEVRFFTLTQAYDGKPMVEDFTKASFITFINNILYSMEQYSYEPTLGELTPAKDFKSAAIRFTSKELASGNSYYAGTAIGTQFSSETECEGEMAAPDGNPRLSKASCIMHLRTAPKPEEAHKLENNPEALRQLLR